jgi:hypothetical protein
MQERDLLEIWNRNRSQVIQAQLAPSLVLQSLISSTLCEPYVNA